LFGQFVTWGLVVGGWIVVDRLSQKREARKEVRSQVDAFIADLRTLEAQAISYHLATTYDKAAARAIKASVEHLRIRLQYLGLLTAGRRAALISRLRRAITSDNFDTVQHVPQEIDGQLIGEISSATDSLVHALESGFREEFPSPWANR